MRHLQQQLPRTVPKLCRSLSFNKLTGCNPATLLKKKRQHKWFPVNLVKPLHKISQFCLIFWCGNSAKTVRFHKISTPRNYVKFRYFTQWTLVNFFFWIWEAFFLVTARLQPSRYRKNNSIFCLNGNFRYAKWVLVLI